MHIVDNSGTLNKYLTDINRQIPDAHLESVCRCYKKNACRYICLTMNGYVCVKHTPVKDYLDEQVKNGRFTAISDNCFGLGKIGDVEENSNGKEEVKKEQSK